MRWPAIFQGRSFSDLLGLGALLLLFTANAFHFNIYQTFSFYRELFGVFFALLALWCLLTRGHLFRGTGMRMNRAVFFLMLFPVLLGLWSFIDSGRQLYAGTAVEDATEQLGSIGLGVYVLRNAMIYLPMVLYFHLRGLNEAEIRLVALTAAVSAPFSIAAYLRSTEVATLVTLGLVAEGGGSRIAYNSYVPYLTFSALCGIFLLFSRTNLFVKVVVLPCIAITAIFCLFSTSRQSVLFIALSLGAFFLFTKVSRRAKWINLAVMGALGAWAFLHFTQGYDLADIFLSRFSDVKGFVGDETGRLHLIRNGLSLLSPLEWLMGAGLTSVIDSGPHNDYVRWTQRVGVPLMILGFMPFLIAFRASWRLVTAGGPRNALFVFLGMGAGFTLFHSLFGYPREDANQAVAVYLGLALWFGALREGMFALPPAAATHPSRHESPGAGDIHPSFDVARTDL